MSTAALVHRRAYTIATSIVVRSTGLARQAFFTHRPWIALRAVKEVRTRAGHAFRGSVGRTLLAGRKRATVGAGAVLPPAALRIVRARALRYLNKTKRVAVLVRLADAVVQVVP